ncbi:hypothetical protein EJ06DRAFT_521135 [Trichodelitschia bisporula]|uniref:Uncharacterized protein n=1 Tax=Trichodelitschia bisporula TaxID=703511 RepID=A0A6G1HZN9_9PEZI|nr:hypothetical protein EJ06DRAFT_521135 [Trichodelitschia bisporula]
MTFPTTPTFIVADAKGWKDLVAHPVMAWTQEYVRLFDEENKLDDYTPYRTSNFKYWDMDGKMISGNRAWNYLIAFYMHFKDTTKHEPSGPVVVWETEKSWEMMGQFVFSATIWNPAKGVRSIPRAYVKDPEARHGGLRIDERRMYVDRARVYGEMIKQNMRTAWGRELAELYGYWFYAPRPDMGEVPSSPPEN